MPVSSNAPVPGAVRAPGCPPTPPRARNAPDPRRPGPASSRPPTPPATRPRRPPVRLRRGRLREELHRVHVQVGFGPGVQRRRPARCVRQPRQRRQRGQGRPGRERLGGRNPFVRVVRGLVRGIRFRAAALLQRVHQIGSRAPAQQQQHERVLVQQPRHLMAERHRVRAVVPLAAVAARIEVPDPGQQRDPGLRRVLGRLRRHLAVQQRRDVPRLRGRQTHHPIPFRFREPLDQHVRPVRRPVRIAHHRRQTARPHRHGADRAPARVPAPLPDLLAVERAVLQGAQPRVPPPGPGEAAPGRRQRREGLLVRVRHVTPRPGSSAAPRARPARRRSVR